MESRSFRCGGVTYPSPFSIIRMNVNTVGRVLLLSQGIYLDYVWTVFFRKKRSMIWSLVIRLLGNDFTKSSGSFSVLISKTMNKGPTFYHSKTQVFFKNSLWISRMIQNFFYLLCSSTSVVSGLLLIFLLLHLYSTFNSNCSDS